MWFSYELILIHPSAKQNISSKFKLLFLNFRPSLSNRPKYEFRMIAENADSIELVKKTIEDGADTDSDEDSGCDRIIIY